MKQILTEICANSLYSAVSAKKGGADRIELCQALQVGGLTPSHALISYCCNKLHIPVFVLIRPRPGNFVYNREEIDIILKDIEFCKKSGANGVVIGFLKNNGSVDKKLLKDAVKSARPMEVTFHRAFDCCSDWHESLEDIIECDCDRILSSGQKETVDEGRETLKEMVEFAGERIKILAGSGITPKNVTDIINYTKVKEVHFSAKAPGSANSVAGRIETSEAIVRNTVALAKS